VLEGQNADSFRTNFASTPWIKVAARAAPAQPRARRLARLMRWP